MAHVLVIDDNPQVVEVARQALQAAGHAVTIVNTPFGSTAAAKRQRPDLVLLDVSMPGLRGDALVPLLRQGLDKTPILFYSALDEDELRELARVHHTDGYVLKTVRPTELVRRVNEALARRA